MVGLKDELAENQAREQQYGEIRTRLAGGSINVAQALIEARKIGVSYGLWDEEIDAWNGLPPGPDDNGPMAVFAREVFAEGLA